MEPLEPAHEAFGRRTKLAGYGLYIVVVIAMVTIGAGLQSLHLHYGLAASQFAVVLLPALLFRHRIELPWPSLREPGASLRSYVTIAIAVTVLAMVANLVTLLVIELVPALRPLAESYEVMVEELLRPEDPVLAAVGVLSICAVAPLCEELLFRGTILEAQRQSGDSAARLCVVNGVLFSLLHVNPFGFVGLAIVGAFFAHLTLLTRSVWPAIFAHAVLNGVSGVVVPAAFADLRADAVDPTLSQIAVGLVVLSPILVLLWRHLARRLVD